jgi:hypothetical protein
MSLSPPLAANHGPMNHFHHYTVREETRDSSEALYNMSIVSIGDNRTLSRRWWNFRTV